MNLKRASFPALLFTSALAGLTGCLFSGDGESTSTDPHVEAIGTYTLSGDTLFMNLPADTSTSCIGDSVAVDVGEALVDTTFFKIEGDAFTLFAPAKEHLDWSGDKPKSTAIFIQTYSVFTRTAGNSGLEGSWRYTEPGYRVTEGTLTAEVKAIWDNRLERQKGFLRFSTTSLNFSGGKASQSLDIRWADRFLALWNGELVFDEGFTPDSTLYDAEVTVVDQNTVKIKGNKTGETVTILFAKDGTETYASDKAERKAYSPVHNPTSCPITTEEWYRMDFLAANAKGGDLFKRGTAHGTKHGHPSFLSW